MQLITASVKVTNSTHFHNQNALIHAFLSTVILQDSLISEIEIEETTLEIVSSTMIFSSMEVRNITNLNQNYFILIDLDSSFTLTDLEYKTSNSILFNIRTSEIWAQNIRFDNIIDAKYLFEVYNATKGSLNNIVITNSTSTSASLIDFKKCRNLVLKRFTIENSDQLVISAKSTHFSKVSELSISN